MFRPFAQTPEAPCYNAAMQNELIHDAASGGSHPATELVQIREQVMRGIALNREPGYHFAGNFLDLSYDHVGTDYTALSLDVAPHCRDADGQINIAAYAILADLVMAAAVRAGLPAHTRLATVTMNLQFNGAARSGRLSGRGAMQGFVKGAAGQQGASTMDIHNDAGLVGTGSATFMVLKPPKGVELHPVPHRRRGENPTPAIPGGRLRPDEKKVLATADAVIASVRAGGGAFIQRFWGVQAKHTPGKAVSVVKNGPHIGNRVGHVQGGILLGLAAENANAALTDHWQLSAISAWYISPGEGRSLRVKSEVIHHGRLIAVVRTQVLGKGADGRARKVLEVTTTHAYRSA
jgi:acyl-coenzyme A thioesterase PaaI-like protein